jgi:hypothetical protein
MRKLRIILVVLVLIGFPAVSWIYLKSGLRWRVDAQQETARKEKPGNFTLQSEDGTIVSRDALEGMYTLAAMPSNAVETGHLLMLWSQFQVRNDFQILILRDANRPAITGDTTWLYASCASGCENLLELCFAEDNTAALLDNALYLRGRYRLDSKDDMRRLIEHLAVVLPIEKRERIELKRGEH